MEFFSIELFLQIIGISSSSGLVYENNNLFLISDSSTFLYEYQIEKNQLTKISLFENSSENIVKKEKPDFESILKIEKSLYIFGSGSTEKRRKGIEYQIEQQKSNLIDLTHLFSKIEETTGIDRENINIEGVVKYLNNWLFFQRGNGIASQNGVIIIEGLLTSPHKINFIPIELVNENEINATFTDAILVENKIYFLATAEDSKSTYDDGLVLGSWIGLLDVDNFKVKFIQKISSENKFEGLTVFKKSTDEISFLLCEDNDTEEMISNIYQLTIKKTTR
jgi:hypothetical protein